MDEIVKIAIVEDDETIRAILEMALGGAGYSHIFSYGNGAEAWNGIRVKRPDVVLLDLMLPGMDGWTLCKKIRSEPSLDSTRVIMLTARGDASDVVHGLDCGADDYIPKPFERLVLLARIRAVLRRGDSRSIPKNFDGLELDENERSVVLNGEELHLAPGEFKILALLIRNRGRVQSRQQILDCVLTDEMKSVTERTIDVQVANLRKKLGSWAEHIETLRGVGYRVKS